MQTVERIQPPIRMRFTPRSIRGRPGGPRRLLAVTLATFLIILIPNLSAQDNRVGEIVANLATGRVIFCVTHDAIIVAATSGGGEVGSHPPAVLPVSSGRIGVLLGAIDWSAPDTAKVTALDSELPAAAANALRRPKQKPAQEPSEIEDIGVGMLEQIRPLVDQIHHKLDLSSDEPLAELILVDYVQDYGPEIWNLQYRVGPANPVLALLVHKPCLPMGARAWRAYPPGKSPTAVPPERASRPFAPQPLSASYRKLP